MLLGEYNGSGNLIREYVYLNGELLAQIDAGSPETILYLHTDHLLTARYATNAGGSTVWSWDSGAFGKETPAGSATINLRFPGQYFDSETGLHYNWHRYYDPTTGRYITSDPLGLAAGLNTYGYAAQNPLSFYDPDGRILPAALIPILAGLGTGLEILGTILAFPAGYYTTAAWINWYLGRGTFGQALCETAWNFGLPLAIGRIGRFLSAAAKWLGRAGENLHELADRIRKAGHTVAQDRRTIAVGRDSRGRLHVGSSNGLDKGMKEEAKRLGIKEVPSKKGLHAEEELLDHVKDLEEIGTSKRTPCGPAEHNCKKQLEDAGVTVTNSAASNDKVF